MDSTSTLRPLSLRRNFGWTLAGKVIYASCQWGILAVLAKLGNPELVGRFAIALAVGAPVILGFNLQLRNVQATDARQEYEFGDYLGLRLVTTALALLVIAVIVSAGGFPVATQVIVLLVGLAKGLEAISDVCWGLFQRRERMDRIARSQLIKGPVSLAALGLTLYITGDLLWACVGLVAARLITLISYDLPWSARLLAWPAVGFHWPRPRWRIATLRRLVLLSMPLGVVAMLVSLKPNIPHYFIQGYLGEAELGVFAALAYVKIAGGTVVKAVGSSAQPRLARYFAQGNLTGFRRLLLRLLGIGGLLAGGTVLVAIVAGGPLLSLLYTPEYGSYAPLFVWLAIAAGAGYLTILLTESLTAMRCFKPQLPLFATGVVATAASAVLLVPHFGLVGAAIATLIGSLLHMVWGAVLVIRGLYRRAG